MRGEKLTLLVHLKNFVGSPPRARGEDAAEEIIREDLRITPACAGRRMSILDFIGDTEDHPRVRGEKADLDVDVIFKGGSPPRARGED